MRNPNSHTWWLGGALGVLLGISLLLSATPALAAPGDGDGDATITKLNKATAAYKEAQAKLDASRARERTLNKDIANTQAALTKGQADIAQLAAQSYRMGGPMAKIGAVLTSRSTQGLMDKMAFLDQISFQHTQRVRALTDTRATLAIQLQKVQREESEQAKHRDEMASRKQKIEQIYAEEKAREERVKKENAAKANPAPPPPPPPSGITPVARNADGSLPKERCNVDDPTTNGCLTPRTMHVFQTVKANGFTKFVSCYRPPDGTSSTHPLGRGCDWSIRGQHSVPVQGWKNAEEKDYGDRLANFFITNWKALGIRYIIWDRRIWYPGFDNYTGQPVTSGSHSYGWHHYFNANAPSAYDNHTNHVHMSTD